MLLLLKLFAIALIPLRLCGIFLIILIGLIVQLALFTWIKPQTIRHIIALWSRLMLIFIGVRLINIPLESTHTSTNPALYVANHISWLDILALQATSPVVFLAKSEIKSWFILGWLVALAGTCFIDRSRRSTLLTVHSTLKAHLYAGQSVCIFPEGTTSDGTQVLPFHAGLLQAAIDASVPVQPIRLEYSHTTAAYVGGISLIGSLMAVLLTPCLHITVTHLPILNTNISHTTRQILAATAYSLINHKKT